MPSGTTDAANGAGGTKAEDRDADEGKGKNQDANNTGTPHHAPKTRRLEELQGPRIIRACSRCATRGVWCDACVVHKWMERTQWEVEVAMHTALAPTGWVPPLLHADATNKTMTTRYVPPLVTPDGVFRTLADLRTVPAMHCLYHAAICQVVAALVACRSAVPGFCHGDLHDANVLVTPWPASPHGFLVQLIDFEYATTGDMHGGNTGIIDVAYLACRALGVNAVGLDDATWRALEEEDACTDAEVARVLARAYPVATLETLCPALLRQGRASAGLPLDQ